MTKKIHRIGMKRVRWVKGIPRLFLSEKHEFRIKWIVRGITAIGVLSCLLVLPWFFAILLSLFLVGLNAFLEKTVFFYTSLFVHAFPKFAYDPIKWLSMAFESVGPFSPASKKTVGLVFSDEDYAKEFFELLIAWNEGDSEDTQGNVKLSFIIDEDHYYVFLYPDLEKRTARKFFNEVEARTKFSKFGKEHFPISMSFIICKAFDTTKGFSLGQFIDNQKHDDEFLLGPYLAKEGSLSDSLIIAKPLIHVKPLILHDYKSKPACDLTEEDFEFVHLKKTGGR